MNRWDEKDSVFVDGEGHYHDTRPQVTFMLVADRNEGTIHVRDADPDSGLGGSLTFGPAEALAVGQALIDWSDAQHARDRDWERRNDH